MYEVPLDTLPPSSSLAPTNTYEPLELIDTLVPKKSFSKAVGDLKIRCSVQVDPDLEKIYDEPAPVNPVSSPAAPTIAWFVSPLIETELPKPSRACTSDDGIFCCSVHEGPDLVKI